MNSEQKVEDYLINELQQTPEMAARLASKVLKYDDIGAEFLTWLEVRTFPEDGLSVEGYQAKRIAEIMPRFTGIGVYNFLTDLRDQPDRMKAYLAEGLPML